MLISIPPISSTPPGRAIGRRLAAGLLALALASFSFTTAQAASRPAQNAAPPCVATIGAQSSATPICPFNTCVVLPVTISRACADPVLGFSVTFQLSADLSLCAGTGSVTEGTFLSSAGATTFQVVDNGGGSYTVDGAVLGDGCGPTATTGTLFHIAVTSSAPAGTGTVTTTAVKLRDCLNGDLAAAPGPPATVGIDNVAPTVTLTSPNGGESYVIGSSQNITWSAIDAATLTIDLAYSTDGGATYPNVIATGIANSGSFAWTVPNTPTTLARVQVTAHDACATVSDASDANFTIRDPIITASAGSGGTIAPSGPVSVPYGTNQTFTITPNDKCIVIADVKVDGVSVGAVSTYTFTNVTTDHTISATFAARGPFTITATAGSGGAIAPSGAVVVACGGTRTFTITPAACRQIADVKVDGVSQGPISTYTFNDVQANHTIAATFSVINYTILATAGPGGVISPSGAQTVACGSNKTFNIIPNPGSTILDVLVDGVSVGPVPTFTFVAVTANHTIHATFEDHAPPTCRLIYPNGGENVFVGDPSKIAWTAQDNFFIQSVDLYLSRNGNAGPWELIAAGLPHNGTYVWPMVTGPGTNTDANPVFSAYFRVDVHDPNGFSATDNSDDGVSLYDLVTETLVSMFEAEPLTEGVALRYQIGHAELFTGTRVERSTSASGPWTVLSVEASTVNGITRLTDLTAEYGQTYFYRLMVAKADGQEVALANLSVQAGIAVKDFELASVGPNPSSTGRVGIQYAVAREARISISVMDVQGRTMATLANGTFRPGRYTATWSGEQERGGKAPAGVYFVRYSFPGRNVTKRIVLAQ